MALRPGFLTTTQLLAFAFKCFELAGSYLAINNTNKADLKDALLRCSLLYVTVNEAGERGIELTSERDVIAQCVQHIAMLVTDDVLRQQLSVYLKHHTTPTFMEETQKETL